MTAADSRLFIITELN